MARRERNVDVSGPDASLAKSARTLGSPRRHAGTGKKIPTRDRLVLEIWWSWGDLNPRPQAFFGQIYMFSGLI